MNLKNLFTKKAAPPPATTRTHEESAPDGKLDMDSLDACVGGRAETQGVGCYAHATQPR